MKKTIPSKNKALNAVKWENKKPPKQKQRQSGDDDEEDELEEFEGQDHNAHQNPNIVYQKEQQDNDNSDNEDKEEGEDQEDLSNKILVEVKPREDYLKEKILNSGLNTSIIKGVSLGLDSTIKHIEKDIKQSNWDIETMKKLTIPSPKKKEHNLQEHSETSTRWHIIKELKKVETSYQNQLWKLNENEKWLKDEGFWNLNSGWGLVEENKRKAQLKDMQGSKDWMISKIDEINKQINSLITREGAQSPKETKKIMIKQFLENFERDKEIVEARAKKYMMESKLRSQKIENDIQQICERRKREMEEKEREEELKKEEKRKEFHDKEKEILLKRTKENTQKLLKMKVFINDKPRNTEKEYYYNKQKEKFLTKEESIIRKEANKRKALMRSVQKEEIDEFAARVNESKQQMQTEQEEKTNKLHQLWNERKQTLPQYKSRAYERVDEELMKEAEAQELKKLDIEAKIKTKKEYSEQIKNEHSPRINYNKKKERMNRIVRLEARNIKGKIIKRKYIKKRKNRILWKKRDPNKPSKYPFLKKGLINEDAKNDMIKKNESKGRSLFIWHWPLKTAKLRATTMMLKRET